MQKSLDKMRGFIIALTFVAACSALSRDAQWEEFKLKYKKGYRNLEQDSERKAIFMSNLDNIEAHNAKFEAGQSRYSQAVNQYSDLTFDEFANTVLMKEVQDKDAKKVSITFLMANLLKDESCSVLSIFSNFLELTY